MAGQTAGVLFTVIQNDSQKDTGLELLAAKDGGAVCCCAVS